MKKQLFIFLIGFISIALFLFGIICAVCAFIECNVLTIISGVTTASIWTFLGIKYFKLDYPSKIYEKYFEKKQ